MHTFYHHGEDKPAVGLSHAQIAGALHDVAGVLWIDVCGEPESSVRDLLVKDLRLDEALVAEALETDRPEQIEVFRGTLLVRALAPAPAPAETAEETADLTLLRGRNYVVTLHARELPALARMREMVAGDSGPMEGGADACANAVVDRVAAAYSSWFDALGGGVDRLRAGAAARSGAAVAADMAALCAELGACVRGAGSLAYLSHGLAWDVELPIAESGRARYRPTAARFARLADRGRDLASEVEQAMWLANLHFARGHARGLRHLTLITAFLGPMAVVGVLFAARLPGTPGMDRPDAWLVAAGAMIAAGLVGVLAAAAGG